MSDLMIPEIEIIPDKRVDQYQEIKEEIEKGNKRYYSIAGSGDLALTMAFIINCVLFLIAFIFAAKSYVSDKYMLIHTIIFLIMLVLLLFVYMGIEHYAKKKSGYSGFDMIPDSIELSYRLKDMKPLVLMTETLILKASDQDGIVQNIYLRKFGVKEIIEKIDLENAVLDLEECKLFIPYKAYYES